MAQPPLLSRRGNLLPTHLPRDYWDGVGATLFLRFVNTGADKNKYAVRIGGGGVRTAYD